MLVLTICAQNTRSVSKPPGCLSKVCLVVFFVRLIEFLSSFGQKLAPSLMNQWCFVRCLRLVVLW